MGLNDGGGRTDSERQNDVQDYTPEKYDAMLQNVTDHLGRCVLPQEEGEYPLPRKSRHLLILRIPHPQTSKQFVQSLPSAAIDPVRLPLQALLFHVRDREDRCLALRWMVMAVDLNHSGHRHERRFLPVQCFHSRVATG